MILSFTVLMSILTSKKFCILCVYTLDDVNSIDHTQSGTAVPGHENRASIVFLTCSCVILFTQNTLF